MAFIKDPQVPGAKVSHSLERLILVSARICRPPAVSEHQRHVVLVSSRLTGQCLSTAKFLYHHHPRPPSRGLPGRSGSCQMIGLQAINNSPCANRQNHSLFLCSWRGRQRGTSREEESVETETETNFMESLIWCVETSKDAILAPTDPSECPCAPQPQTTNHFQKTPAQKLTQGILPHRRRPQNTELASDSG